MEDVTSIKIEDVVKIFFAGKYFCNTHVGLSAKNDIKFQNHKNIHIKRVDFNWSQKKKTNVKWKHIHTKPAINQ